MPRKGQSAWNKKFGQVARECFRATAGGSSMHSYGSCMASELKKVSPKRRKAATKRKKSKR